MKKFFTLVFATMLAGNMMAQMHGALTFAGASTMSVLTQNTENASDTVKFEMASMSTGNITLPAMKGMATFNSAATGISSVKNDVQKKNDGKMYNLNGQVVSESYKGVVIVNGKKYFKK